MAQTIKLNIIPKGIPDVVNVSQFDIGRTLQFNLYEGAQIYTIPAGATAVIGGKKGDANIFTYDATISEDRHTVTAITTEQMTAIAGENLCQLRLNSVDAEIATINFRMFVQERPDVGDIESVSEIPAIIELARQQQYNAQAWAEGKKGDVPVSSSEPQYNNHAKYWAEQAAQSVTGVASFNGRQGAVMSVANDYDATQIKYGTDSNVNTELGNKINKTGLITKLLTALSTGWSSVVDSDGYYINTVSIGADINPIAFRPIIGVCGNTFDTEETAEQAAAFSLCNKFSFANTATVSSIVIKAKTKPTETFYFTVSGFNV